MPSAAHKAISLGCAVALFALPGCRQREGQETAVSAPADAGPGDAGASATRPEPVIIPSPPPGEFETLARGVGQAVVNIRTEGKVTGGPASMYPNAHPDSSLGSGILIDREQGYVLTNLHLVENVPALRVVFQSGEERDAELVGPARHLDIALLQLGGRALPEDIQAASLSRSEGLAAGQWVVALGNPFGGEVTASAGIIASTGDTTSVYEPPHERYRSLLHTDAAIHRGNTGGPLVDLAGRVVGINIAPPEMTGRSHGFGFAVPAWQVRRVFDQLQKGAVTEPWLGAYVRQAKSEEAEGCGGRGVYITQVVRHGPAEMAGLRSGDVILRFDGREVDKPKLESLVRSARLDTRVVLAICRNGGVLSRPLVVEAKPN